MYSENVSVTVRAKRLRTKSVKVGGALSCITTLASRASLNGISSMGFPPLPLTSVAAVDSILKCVSDTSLAKSDIVIRAEESARFKVTDKTVESKLGSI